MLNNCRGGSICAVRRPSGSAYRTNNGKNFCKHERFCSLARIINLRGWKGSCCSAIKSLHVCTVVCYYETNCCTALLFNQNCHVYNSRLHFGGKNYRSCAVMCSSNVNGVSVATLPYLVCEVFLYLLQ